MSELIKATKICRDFKQGSNIIHALSDVNISINSKTLTMLAGRSGSGKTTLMNIAGALDRPTSGKIYFDSIDLTDLSESKKDDIRRKNIGFVFQSVALISVLNAYENVEFGLRMAGVNPKYWDDLVRESLKFVGLEKRMKHKPHQLSGGEQQRVAIARAIVSRPKLIFADEPTAELDTKSGLKIVNLFRHLVDEENMTIVMTTHDPSMIELSDDVIRLEDGRVI